MANKKVKEIFDAELEINLLRIFVENSRKIASRATTWLGVAVVLLGISVLMRGCVISDLQDKVGILECRHWGEDAGQPWAYYDDECHLM